MLDCRMETGLSQIKPMVNLSHGGGITNPSNEHPMNIGRERLPPPFTVRGRTPLSPVAGKSAIITGEGAMPCPVRLLLGATADFRRA